MAEEAPIGPEQSAAIILDSLRTLTCRKFSGQNLEFLLYRITLRIATIVVDQASGYFPAFSPNCFTQA